MKLQKGCHFFFIICKPEDCPTAVEAISFCRQNTGSYIISLLSFATAFKAISFCFARYSASHCSAPMQFLSLLRMILGFKGCNDVQRSRALVVQNQLLVVEFSYSKMLLLFLLLQRSLQLLCTTSFLFFEIMVNSYFIVVF